MDNFNQAGSNPQLDILNRLQNQTGVDQNNPPFLPNNNANKQITQNNLDNLSNNSLQMNNIPPQNNNYPQNFSNSLFQNGNPQLENPINSNPMPNPINTPINVVSQAVNTPTPTINVNPNLKTPSNLTTNSNPFASEDTYVEQRKKELSDNNFDSSAPKNGFVDVLKEGGVDIEVPKNKFISDEGNFNETSINDLNIDGEYNKLSNTEYSNDPKVIANINDQKKKNTVKISKEFSTFLLICAILLIFIFIMPYIFDFIRNIQSR